MLVRTLLPSNKTVIRPVQLWNAFEPIVVTVSGMDTDVRPLQLWNELLPMLVRVLTSSNKTVFRPSHR